MTSTSEAELPEIDTTPLDFDIGTISKIDDPSTDAENITTTEVVKEDDAVVPNETEISEEPASPEPPAPAESQPEPAETTLTDPKDIEIDFLKKRVAELENEVSELKKKLDDRSAMNAFQPQSKLSHVTKGRAHPRRAAKREEDAGEASPAGEESGDLDKESAEPSTESPSATEPADPAVEFKKKIATMGGVNAFGMGFNPFAGVSNPTAVLKSRSSMASQRTNSGSEFIDASVALESEGEIRNWIAETVGDDALKADSGKGSTGELLKDGVVLCKLATALKPETPVKSKGGKFAFIHQENLGNYFKACEAMGVSGSVFTYDDLKEESGLPKVLSQLITLKKATTKA
ncbi:Transgelin [Blyttiomyces sp. JEL0837]|nr:Transgelin [Blyttiomyces sp. JEL0837]